MRLRILNVEPENFSPAALAILESFAEVDARSLSVEDLRRHIPDYDVVMVRLGYRVDGDLMARAPRLRAIVTATTGLDHVDVEAARARGVEVFSLQGEREFLDTVTATAEHAWALLLAVARRLPAAFASVMAEEWDRDRFVGRELRGRTLGVVGCGRLGTMVARFGLTFGMRVLAHDRRPVTLPDEVTAVTLPELLRQADVVSLHVPLCPATQGMLGAREFGLMKPGAVLINTSRGPVVDEAALLEALESCRLGGAGLDVLAGEEDASGAWMKTDPLIEYARRHDDLVITPHVGGATHESMERTEVFMARKLQAAVVRWSLR
ncbi:MAG: hydroxyacid dehydrogenase [Candidatus Rokubacteria bacterium]|nr:hydroxyacid dehydrogenase [Candidatus Rokubacteria bacterium]